MRAPVLLSNLASLCALAACATTPDPVVVPLAPAPSNAGSFAQATLLPAPDGTRMTVFFTAAGPQPTSPLHVYTYLYEGRCEALPQQPARALNDNVLVRTANGDIAQSRRGAFMLSHAVPLPLAELADGRYALVLRSSPADGGGLLYCGELRGLA
ncbi:hypothetical protein H8N03_18535 [Ramlibacter sp. USB13]|uniref:CHRD domain-containing protein n=1 Tax=Ramlibacter cellulosilyticus TaxID=2764187 RepID=A0A923MTZ1_9BURK|nr:hypothetical protein [Ramlibacter cellulosilyticus]MBC5784951.1 hypothetical protein [Ramlibacter cellulosilyticus]